VTQQTIPSRLAPGPTRHCLRGGTREAGPQSQRLLPKLAASLNEIEFPFREPAHLDLVEATEVAVIVEARFGGNRAGFGWPDVEPGERLVQLAPQGADQPADAEK
jgi:hypothetical protein